MVKFVGNIYLLQIPSAQVGKDQDYIDTLYVVLGVQNINMA